MFLDQFHSSVDGKIRVSAQQASRFAKEVAGDFNPIHDPDAKRFCVPGDLLFALVLAHYGVSQRMKFAFTGMVGEDVALSFPETSAEEFEITDDAGKSYLRVRREGPVSRSDSFVEGLARSYVAFSGRNFPHVLVPLMAEHKVMVNPDRPLVIYESMDLELKRLDAGAPMLELADASLTVSGKRGDAQLDCHILADGEVIGSGAKKLVLSGLREYDESAMEQLVEQYAARKTAYRP